MEIKVVENDIRIDSYLSNVTEYSRSKITKLIKDGKVLVNGKEVTPSYKVKENDVIYYEEIEPIPLDVEPENIPLDIVYEDEYLAVINKQSGLVVHPAAGNYKHTLVNGLIYHFNDISKNKTIRPGLVHRLDKDTSGLMVVAKDDTTHDKLAEMIKNKEVKRRYLALVWGVLKHDKGTIDAPIGRDFNNRQKYTVTDINGKESVTHFKVIERYKDATLLNVTLDTGRTHQIRVHMDYIGHPIVNDPVYGKRKIINSFGQMLHSESIEFVHPITKKEINFKTDPPKEFYEILDIIKER